MKNDHLNSMYFRNSLKKFDVERRKQTQEHARNTLWLPFWRILKTSLPISFKDISNGG
jgi:hypothetical protein